MSYPSSPRRLAVPMIGFVLATFCLPLPGAAQAVRASAISVSYGLDIVSDKISDGVSETEGRPAIQPWLEIEHSSGIYFGTSGSTLYADGTELFEYDLTAGFRRAHGPVDFDLSYSAKYFDLTGYDGADLAVAVGVEFGLLEVCAEISHDLSGTFDHGLAFKYGLSDAFALSGDIDLDATGSRSWSLGLGWALADRVSVDLRYHDADRTLPMFTVGLSFFR